MRKLTTQEFIERAKLVHGEKYDYSKTVYVNSRSKVIITCTIHGDFEQLANAHLQGLGCPKCSGRGFGKEEIIENFISKHGLKYIYDEIPDFPKSHLKVPIICPKHGKFILSVYSHLSGLGCPKCSSEKQSERQTYKWEELKEIFIKLHNNKYDYSKVVYVNMETPINIVCPIHGEFLLKPKDHIRGAGCKKCKSSKGELLIGNILKELNINYTTLYLIHYKNKKLYIDFRVIHNNLVYFIEYNGILHYIPVEHFGGELKFQKLQERDSLLRNYCNQNNINLVEVKYDMKNKEIKTLMTNIFKNNES